MKPVINHDMHELCHVVTHLLGLSVEILVGKMKYPTLQRNTQAFTSIKKASIRLLEVNMLQDGVGTRQQSGVFGNLYLHALYNL